MLSINSRAALAPHSRSRPPTLDLEFIAVAALRDRGIQRGAAREHTINPRPQPPNPGPSTLPQPCTPTLPQPSPLNPNRDPKSEGCPPAQRSRGGLPESSNLNPRPTPETSFYIYLSIYLSVYIYLYRSTPESLSPSTYTLNPALSPHFEIEVFTAGLQEDTPLTPHPESSTLSQP